MRAIIGILVLIAVFGSAATLFHLKREAAIKATAISLIPLYNRWSQEGKPTNVVIQDYVIDSTDQYLVDTKPYVVGGIQKTGLFRLNSTRLPFGQFLVVNTDG